MPATWLPKTFTVLRGYDRRQFLADLQAGVVVGIVAIPLALAFAIASGVAPEKGLVTAVVGGFLISLLGGPDGVEIYEVNGPFFFGAADKIKDVLHVVARKPKAFVLRMRNVPAMDASGMRVLDDLYASFTHQGIVFLIAGIHAQPLHALDKAGRLDRYGRQNFVADLDAALARARGVLAGVSGTHPA